MVGRREGGEEDVVHHVVTHSALYSERPFRGHHRHGATKDIVVNGDSDDNGYGLTARRNGGLTDADERQGVRSGRLTEDRGEAHDDDDLFSVFLC